MVLFYGVDQSYRECVNQLPALLPSHPTAEVLDVATEVEVTGVPAKLPQTTPATWWPAIQPQVQTLAPVAAAAAGRAVVDSMSSGLAADQDVLDQATLELAQAAGVIARDDRIPAEMRCGVLTEMTGLVAGRSVLKDRSEARGYEWAERLLTGAIVTGVLAVVVQLLGRRPR